MDPDFASVSHKGGELKHESKRQAMGTRAGNHGGKKPQGVQCIWFRETALFHPHVLKKNTGTKNGKTGASERKQSAHIKSRPISLSQQYSGFKKILKKIIIKDMNVKGKCDKTQQE